VAASRPPCRTGRSRSVAGGLSCRTPATDSEHGDGPRTRPVDGRASAPSVVPGAGGGDRHRRPRQRSGALARPVQATGSGPMRARGLHPPAARPRRRGRRIQRQPPQRHAAASAGPRDTNPARRARPRHARSPATPAGTSAWPRQGPHPPAPLAPGEHQLMNNRPPRATVPGLQEACFLLPDLHARRAHSLSSAVVQYSQPSCRVWRFEGRRSPTDACAAAQMGRFCAYHSNRIRPWLVGHS
jgi:hypothetical protein